MADSWLILLDIKQTKKSKYVSITWLGSGSEILKLRNRIRNNYSGCHNTELIQPWYNLSCVVEYGDTMTNIVVIQFSEEIQTSMDMKYNLTCTTRAPGTAVVSSGYIGAG